MKSKNEKIFKILSIIIFIIYIVLLFWVVIFKCNLVDSITKTYEYLSTMTIEERFKIFLLPFNDYFEGPFVSQWKNTLQDDILNVIIFIPLGLYVTYFFRKKKLLYKTIITVSIGLGLSIIFEVFQLFSLIGSFSSKDMITNTLGVIIGNFFSVLIVKKENNKIKMFILNIISIIVIVVFVPIAIYAFGNTIKNIDLYYNLVTKKL